MPHEPSQLRAAVFDAMTNARANGHGFKGWSARDIAIDMATYDAELQGEEPETLMPYIEDFRRLEAEGKI